MTVHATTKCGREAGRLEASSSDSGLQVQQEKERRGETRNLRRRSRVLPFSPSHVALRRAAVARVSSRFEEDLPVLPKRIALATERPGDQASRVEQAFEVAACVPGPLPRVGMQLDDEARATEMRARAFERGNLPAFNIHHDE